MIIKASQRGGGRNLSRHLANRADNDHVEFGESRGFSGRSIHACLLEISGVASGTKCKQPLFSVSFNPLEAVNVTNEQFFDAFDRLEKKLGLEGQPRFPVFHEKNGRRHAHCVWSRIDIDKMKAINMAFFKEKCMQVSRELYLENGWEMPAGFIDKNGKDPFDVFIGEFQQLLKRGIDPTEIKQCCQEAWSLSDSLSGFQRALEERSLFLAQGDRRGFVILDQNRKVYSLSRFGGIKTKDLKARLGEPDNLPSVTAIKNRIRTIFNTDIRSRIDQLKSDHDEQLKPLLEIKDHLVNVQRAERQELADQQRVKRNIQLKSDKDRFRRGIGRQFNRAAGVRNDRSTIPKRLDRIQQKQNESRQLMIFRHNLERSELQTEIIQKRDKHMQERQQLAKRIYEFRQVQEKDQTTNRQKTAGGAFDKAVEQIKPQTHNKDTSGRITRQRPKRTRKRDRTLE